MEEIKQGWKKRISWLLIAITVVIVYKMLDNFSNVTEWFGTFFRILKPFLAGLLISYILFMPCKKIEGILEKSKFKFVKKRARGLSVITTYIIFILIVIIIINCIFPVLKESVVELVGNIPGYYETLVNKYKELPNTKDARNFMRFFLSGATQNNTDKQGRLNIPQSLVKYASLNKDCIIIGVNDHLEIWSEENWNKFMEENEESFTDISDSLFSNNII